MATINFGILGCAEIARKVSRGIMLAPNASLVAVASRSGDKAAKFAADNRFPAEAKIYGCYEDLLDDPEVDAVYMPLPTSLHLYWAVLAAQKKKHLLMEKPVALNVHEFDKIVEACVASGVQFMDGTMWMHHPRTAKLREFLSDSDRFGQLKTIHSNFTFTADSDFLRNNIRVKPELDGLGALGDQGWYCIRSILFFADYKLPTSVTALPGTVTNQAGVLLSCGASLLWEEDGKVATFNCSFLSHLTMDITAIATNATLHLHDYVIPFQENQAPFTASSKSCFNHLATGWVSEPTHHLVSTQLPQEANMVTEFSRLVGLIKTTGSKPEMSWPEISRKTQLVLDSVKLSIQKGYATIQLMSD